MTPYQKLLARILFNDMVIAVNEIILYLDQTHNQIKEASRGR